jgi:hypothetical protein
MAVERQAMPDRRLGKAPTRLAYGREPRDPRAHRRIYGATVTTVNMPCLK